MFCNMFMKEAAAAMLDRWPTGEKSILERWAGCSRGGGESGSGDGEEYMIKLGLSSGA